MSNNLNVYLFDLVNLINETEPKGMPNEIRINPRQHPLALEKRTGDLVMTVLSVFVIADSTVKLGRVRVLKNGITTEISYPVAK